jgi:YD repeat-containing protein
MNSLVKIEISQSGTGVLPVSSVTTLKYSSLGKLIEVSDENGKIEFAYDTFGRVLSEKGPVGLIEYEYNSAGRLSEKTCSFNPSMLKTENLTLNAFSTKYFYDELDRVVKVSSPAGDYGYSYDSKGRISSLSFFSQGKSVYVCGYSYDKVGRLTSKKMNDTALCAYEYDKLDRIVKSEVNGNKWQYAYDQIGQLVSAKSAELGNYKYGYDKIANRLKDKIQLASRNFSYNNLNQIANQGFEYDAYGNLVKTLDTRYKYDLHNRLIEFEKTDISVKYSYDPLGQRIRSKEIVSGNTKTTSFLISIGSNSPTLGSAWSFGYIL